MLLATAAVIETRFSAQDEKKKIKIFMKRKNEKKNHNASNRK
jgi:hypothetical protein